MIREFVKTNDFRRSILIGVVVGWTGGSDHIALPCLGGAIMGFLLWNPDAPRIRERVRVWPFARWLLAGFAFACLATLEQVFAYSRTYELNWLAMLVSICFVSVVRMLIVAFDIEV